MFGLGPAPPEQTVATLPLPLTGIVFFQEHGLPTSPPLFPVLTCPSLWEVSCEQHRGVHEKRHLLPRGIFAN